MECLVLAAGSGQRLSSIHRDAPKSLVPLADYALIDYVLSGLSLLAPEKIHVIGGFAIERLEHHLSTHWPATSLYPVSAVTPGNLTTLLSGLSHSSGDLLVANADHAYSRRILQQLAAAIAARPHTPFIVCDRDRPLMSDDMKVLEADGGLAQIAKTLTTYTAGYIGMTYIPHQARADYDALARTLSTDRGDRTCAEDVLQAWVTQGKRVNILDVSGSHWIEIDTPEDYDRAMQILGTHQSEFNYLAF